MWGYSKNTPAPGEKSLIDFNVIDNWRQIGHYLSVSDDGKYIAYTTKKPSGTMYWYRRQDSLVIQSTRNNWRQGFVCKTQGLFTADNKQYIFQDGSDLHFLQLGKDQQKVVKDITGYKVSQNKWLAYQLKGRDSLILQNLATGNEQYFAGITQYNFDNNGDWLIGKVNTKKLLLYNLTSGTEKRFSNISDYSVAASSKSLLLQTADANLQYVNLPKGNAKTIWQSKEKTGIGNYSLDASGSRVLFSIIDSSSAMNNSTWYYEDGIDEAVVKASTQTAGIPTGLIISGASFTDNGRYINLSLQAKAETLGKLTDDMVGVEVWNHKDVNLQSLQAKQEEVAKSYSAILNIETSKLVFLESDTKKISMLQGDFALVKNDYKDLVGDRFWEKETLGRQDSTWVVNLTDGSSSLIATGQNDFWFSPSGNYLVWCNKNNCQYNSYDLHSCVVKNVSSQNKIGVFDRFHGNAEASANGCPAAWIEKDGGLLVYDNYDIWKLDLTGKESPLNITRGKANNIMFSLMENYRNNFKNPVLKANESLILQTYNTSIKQNGFYKKTLGSASNPQVLSMGNYYTNYINEAQDINLANEFEAHPTKAKNTNYWILQRQTESDAPNYFETTDFKNFNRLTNFQPQKNYQWLSQELVSFKHLDGKMGQGILYKPENFDPKKKYPVLIIFYGAYSDNMFQFQPPAYMDCSILDGGKSPAWFLNSGYLVFTPDIYTEPRKYGPKAFGVIEGAAQYLKSLPYVDGDKLGCAAHSWSAQLGAYIYTHSTSICATAISEGMQYGNMLNYAFSPTKSGSKLEASEKERESGSLWENKASWLEQTTVLNVDKAVSPLLLFCNKASSADYQDQTFQIFNALRRLDKNVWWLKYDNGDHTLHDQKELRDYTIRYTQFFDHYLKNAPAPQWMTEGIPYKLKGIESRYELDPKGSCAVERGEFGIGNKELGEKTCVICAAWNLQCKRHPEMLKKPIVEWELDRDIAEELERKQNEKRKELDKEGEVMNKKIVDILKNGYPKDEKRKLEK
jgi:dipeptidyl aminopeptidase/acylaminoacyl peptidase